MKHLTRNSLLALGIAIPLWLRQYRYEQAVDKEVVRFSGEVVKDLERVVSGWERWGKELVKQINAGGSRR